MACILLYKLLYKPVTSALSRKIDADILSSRDPGVTDSFISHNVKIQDRGGRHLVFSGYVNSGVLIV